MMDLGSRYSVWDFIPCPEFCSLFQAMGVYLYGEMMISGNLSLQCLAKDCFKEVAEQMESGTRDTVQSMLYAS